MSDFLATSQQLLRVCIVSFSQQWRPAWLLMLCYHFAINPPHKKRARVPVLIPSDSLLLPPFPYKPKGLLHQLQCQLSKGLPNTKPQKVTIKKDGKGRGEKKAVSAFFPHKDKKMEKLKGGICSATAKGHETRYSNASGPLFFPKGSRVVSSAKCRNIVRMGREEWLHFII